MSKLLISHHPLIPVNDMPIDDVEINDVAMSFTAIICIGVAKCLTDLVGCFFWYTADNGRVMQTFNLPAGIAHIHAKHALV